MTIQAVVKSLRYLKKNNAKTRPRFVFFWWLHLFCRQVARGVFRSYYLSSSVLYSSNRCSRFSPKPLVSVFGRELYFVLQNKKVIFWKRLAKNSIFKNCDFSNKKFPSVSLFFNLPSLSSISHKSTDSSIFSFLSGFFGCTNFLCFMNWTRRVFVY